MKSLILGVMFGLVLCATAAETFAAVSVERRGDENPMAVIAKSTGWGMVTGFLVGTAINLAQNRDDGDALRLCTCAGTFAGLGVGIWFVTHRPAATALLEAGRGEFVCGGLDAIEATPGRVRLHAVGLRF